MRVLLRRGPNLSLRERSTRVSAAGEGLQVFPESALPLTLAALDLSHHKSGVPDLG